MQQNKEETLVIVGAGLAGTLLSLFLAKRGYRVAVYERHPDMRRQSIPAGRSINLALAERGLHALRQVGVEQVIAPLLTPMQGRLLHDEAGKTHLQRYGQKAHEVIYSISRPGLNACLLDAAERTGKVTFHFEYQCRSVDKAKAMLHFTTPEGEHSVPFAHCFACDGAASAVRHAVIPETAVEEIPLEHSYKELCIPAADDGSHRIEKNALHIWPRGEFMLIALPNLSGSFTVTLFLPNQGAESFATLTTEEKVVAFFKKYFPDTVSLLPELTRDFFANPTGFLGTLRTAQWHYQDNILLLGDAAHAIVPFHGQGMNCAFEDCSVLDELMTASADNWDELFQNFVATRRAHTEAIANMALENYLEMRSTVRDPKFHLKKAVAWRLEAQYPQQFIPRYSMVMFHRIPYADVEQRGQVQADILEQLVADCEYLDAVDWAKAETLVKQRLSQLKSEEGLVCTKQVSL